MTDTSNTPDEGEREEKEVRLPHESSSTMYNKDVEAIYGIDEDEDE